jgi:hypothetical protein
VDSYLPNFRDWLITHLMLALLPVQPSFTESLSGCQVLSLVHFQLPTPSAVCYFLVSCLFSVFIFVGGVSLPKGLCWLIFKVAGGIPCDAWHSPV